MSFLSKESKASDEPAAEVATGARLIPRITIQAFCEHSQTAQLIESAIHDRRMSKVALTTHNGGLDGAVETYKSNPTPNLILVETSLPPADIPAALSRLAEVCDATTRLIVLGHANDVVLYRELIRSGVSEYIVLPSSAQQVVAAITELFAAEGAAPIGRTIGFVSAKGGAGGSTVAHNVAWAISQNLRQDVLILDMDLAFGTAGLNFNQDPPHGLHDAIGASQKMDGVMLDRLMSKAANHINLLTAPVSLDQTYDHGERDFEQVLELSQKTTPIVILDIPHTWDAWVRHTLATIDEIVIVAEPDLANLRNAKNLSDTIKALRPAEIGATAGHQQARHAAAAGNQRYRIRELDRLQAAWPDSVRRGAVRHRCQQWPDDCRSGGEQSHQRGLPHHRPACERPHRARDRKARAGSLKLPELFKKRKRA